MPERVSVGVAGTGAYMPSRVITNEYFEQIVDTSDEWIIQRTGIRERRFAAEGEGTGSMSIEAGKQACEAAGIEPADLDLVLLGTLTPDHLLPATSVRVAHGMGAVNAGAMDVNAACSGFLSVLSLGEGMVSAGRARNVLCIGAERLSSFIDMQDRSSCILFGDGAGACILRPHADCKQGEILKTVSGSDGSGYEFIHMEGGGSAMPPTHESVEARKHFIGVRGREVYRFAVSTMSRLIKEMLEGTEPDELGLIVPHQVNQRIIDSALERLDLPTEKCLVNIDRYGNTSSATVPVALDEAARQGRLEKGKLVVLVAFGAGLTWGASLIRW